MGRRKAPPRTKLSKVVSRFVPNYSNLFNIDTLSSIEKAIKITEYLTSSFNQKATELTKLG